MDIDVHFVWARCAVGKEQQTKRPNKMDIDVHFVWPRLRSAAARVTGGARDWRRALAVWSGGARRVKSHSLRLHGLAPY